MENLGQILMVGLEGETLTAREETVLKEMQPSGVTLFSRNLRTVDQIIQLNQNLFEILHHPTPIIAIDQEGGAKERLPVPPFTHWPGNRLLGTIYEKTGSDELTRKQFQAIALELKSLGINVNFAPLIDVPKPEGDAYIDERALGSSPEVVRDLGIAAMQAMHAEGVIACAKHFPGHGDTSSDSHMMLPRITSRFETIKRRDLVPFQGMIDAGCHLVMTAHILFADLDSELPASLSIPIVHDLLRRDMGFGEVLVSDDLNMKGITEHYTRFEAAELALVAGCDLLLYCEGIESAYETYEHLKGLMKIRSSDDLLKTRVQGAIERVTKFKKAHLLSAPKPDQNLVKKITESGDHQKLVEAIASAAQG